MKKAILSAFVFLITMSTAFSQTHFSEGSRQIECLLHEIDRVAIHPEGASPFVSFEKSSSSNWSGYVVVPFLSKKVNHSVNSVQGTWVVPTLVATQDTTYSAIWVGIDGYTNGTVEQIGTSHNWVDGAQENYAWFEMYPSGAYQIVDFPVDNGDEITASVEYAGAHVFVLSITNTTQNVHTVIPTSYTTSTTAKRSSAEWVVEAPAGSSGVLPLADFGSATFTNCSTNILGFSGPIGSPRWQKSAITMKANHVLKAKPSKLVNKNQFNVAWSHE